MRRVSYVVVLVPGGGLVDGDHDAICNDENDDDDDHAMITLQMEQMGFWWGVHWTNQFLGDGVTRDRDQGGGRVGKRGKDGADGQKFNSSQISLSGDGVTRTRDQGQGGPGRETGREKGKFLERKIQQFIQIGIK